MANIFKKIGRLFGLSSQKKASPAKTFIEQPGQVQRFNILSKRAAGEGVGIPEERFRDIEGILSKRGAETTARAAEGIKATASAAGLGRSTIPGRQVGREARLTGTRIEDKVANLRLAGEELRQADIRSALSGLGQVGASSQASEQFNKTLLAGDLAKRRVLEGEGLTKALGLGAKVFGGLLSPEETEGETDFGKTFGNILKGDNAAMVNLGDSDILKLAIKLGLITVGGVVGGPPGAAVGATAGSVIA